MHKTKRENTLDCHKNVIYIFNTEYIFIIQSWLHVIFVSFTKLKSN